MEALAEPQPGPRRILRPVGRVPDPPRASESSNHTGIDTGRQLQLLGIGGKEARPEPHRKHSIHEVMDGGSCRMAFGEACMPDMASVRKHFCTDSLRGVVSSRPRPIRYTTPVLARAVATRPATFWHPSALSVS